MSVVYRERERERDRYDDSRSSFSSAQRGGNYTTVKQYRVRDDDAHSATFDGRRYGTNARARDSSNQVEETKIVRREREEIEPRTENTYSRRDRGPAPESRWEDDIVIRRTKEADEPPRRDFRHEEPSTDRELVIKRTSERDGFDRARDGAMERYDERRRDYRDYEVISPQRENYGDLQRYSRTAEYYSQPSQPSTIIIRNEPIIIREKVRDEDYALIQRSEVEDRQVSRRKQSPARKDDFYYEKTVEKRDGRPNEREEDFYARREVREVSPGDSISQVGAARRRSRSRGRSRYSDSDESMVYVRKETKEASRSESPGHRRHLAEGALAGFGAAELLRHHKKSTGKETSGPAGRLGKDVGAGMLGAVAASGLSRARSQIRSKSRRRGRSYSTDRDDRRRGRSRTPSRTRSETRSHSRTRLKTLGGLALAAAAAGTAVAVVKKKKKQRDQSASSERRSRSRHRRHSSSSSSAPDDSRNPAHRNKRIAEAGVAGAAVAGLLEGARNKSRSRKGERSQSRLRKGLPVAAAGLGSAAIAGIYERNKAQRDEEAAAVAERKRSRSRSRGRSRSNYSDVPRGNAGDPNLIEYGTGAMYGQIPQADYYGRAPVPHDGYYSDAVVPTAAAAPAAAGYAARPRRSHSRDRPSSSDSSGGGRHRRHHRQSRSQSRNVATPALAALGGGLAVNEVNKRKDKRKDKARRRRHEAAHGHDPYEDEYDPAPNRYTPTPPSSADPYQNPDHYYRADEQLPPPPGSAPAPLYPPQQQAPMAGYSPQQGPFPAQTAYNPANYTQQPGGMPPPNPAYPSPQRPSPGAGYPPGGPFASGGNGDPRYPRGRGDENVSAPPNGNLPSGGPRHASPDGLNPTRHAASPSPHRPRSGARSSSQPAPASAPKNVAFDLGSERSRISSPDVSRQRRRKGGSRGGETSNRGYEAEDDSDSTIDGRDKRYPTHHPVSETESDPEKAARRRHRQNERHRDRRRRRPDEPEELSRYDNNPGPDDTDEHHQRHRHRRHRRSHRPSSDKHYSAREVDPTNEPPSPTPSEATDETVDLPERFDKHGRKKPERGEDAMADFVADMLSGKGPGGKYLKKIFGDHNGDDNEASGSGTRRRR